MMTISTQPHNQTGWNAPAFDLWLRQDLHRSFEIVDAADADLLALIDEAQLED